MVITKLAIQLLWHEGSIYTLELEHEEGKMSRLSSLLKIRLNFISAFEDNGRYLSVSFFNGWFLRVRDFEDSKYLISADASGSEPVYVLSQFGTFRGRWWWCDGFDRGGAGASGVSGRASWWIIRILTRMVSSAASHFVANETSVLFHVVGAFDRGESDSVYVHGVWVVGRT